MMPLIIPYVVLVVALLILLHALGITLSLVTVAIAHVVVALPYTTLIVLARLIGFDQRLEEAAMDLGASYPATVRLVVLPIAAPAIVSAWITAFAVSLTSSRWPCSSPARTRRSPSTCTASSGSRQHCRCSSRRPSC